MKILTILTIALMLGPVPLSFAGDVILRTSVTPEEAWVGQRVILHIDVLAEDGWAQIPKLNTFDAPGAYVMRTESQGTRLQEKIDGTSYTGQRYQMSLYPQRGGTIEIPALPVVVSIKNLGVGARDTIQNETTPGATFECKVPPGAEKIRGLISTTQLTATQTWEPEQEEVAIGDAIKRIITLKATDVSGMAFVPLRYPAIEGLGIYPSEATVNDTSTRGSLTGTRVESVTYIFEQAGSVTIPDKVLTWWDAKNQELQQITLPGFTRTVTASPQFETAALTLSDPPQTNFRWAAWTMFAFVGVLMFSTRKRALRYLNDWRAARHDREVVYYTQIIDAIRAEDSTATLQATMKWLDKINNDPLPARLDSFLRLYGDDQSPEAVNGLVRAFLAPRGSWNFKELRYALDGARKKWQREQRKTEYSNRILPKLNE
jgi:hypothetical protein